GHGDDAEARDRPVGGFDADGAGECGGLANGSAGVGAHGQRCLEPGQGRCRTAGGSAGDVIEVPRVAGVAKAECSVVDPIANSSRLVLPSTGRPAALTLLWTVDS